MTQKTIKITGITKPVSLDTPIHAEHSPNFTWGEATHGGERIPKTKAEVANIIAVAALAQQLRDFIKVPMTVTSWFRPEPFNSAAGGASKSFHLTGAAVDVRAEGFTGAQLYAIADKLFAGKYGVGYYGGSRNRIVHLDARKGKAGRWFHK